jgi:hypothetical protein
MGSFNNTENEGGVEFVDVLPGAGWVMMVCRWVLGMLGRNKQVKKIWRKTVKCNLVDGVVEVEWVYEEG